MAISDGLGTVKTNASANFVDFPRSSISLLGDVQGLGP